MCTWSNRFYEGVNTEKVMRLFEIAYENNVMCDNREVALQLHLYFKHEVYQSGQGMPMLTKEIALEHIECHTPRLGHRPKLAGFK